jgi:UDP-3-O-[3-hydroxymyristoyl] N-acetylglucosamine deacetylase
MSVLNQKTIKQKIVFNGVGLHSGLNINLIIKPAEPNTGIIYKRTDLKENNIIIPDIFNVSSASFCTTISNESGVSISTIEHVMGALYGLGIDNVIIEIDNREVPILDGSAKLFVHAIQEVGIEESSSPIKVIKINNNNILTSHKYLRNQSIEKIKQSQMLATEKVFTSKRIPFRSFRVLKRDEKSLGELFCFFILETILLGRALAVNPFDQPSVELIKKETKKILR